MLEEIHRTLAEKARYRQRLRRVVHTLRLSDVFDSPVDEHGQNIADAHRFDMVVRHVENRTRKTLLHTDDFIAHGTPQGRVKVRERLVEQQGNRLGEQGARDRCALTLAAGELTWPALKVLFNVKRGGRCANVCLVALAAPAQRKTKILANGHVSEERIVLSDERDAARLRWFVEQGLAVEAYVAAARPQ